MDNSYHELKEGIRNYHTNKASINANFIATKNLFDEESKDASPEILKYFDTDILRSNLQELGILNEIGDTKELEKPTIAIIGTVNSGKSCFINSLLRKKVVPESTSKCTGRLIRLHYSTRNCIKIIDGLGNIKRHRSLVRRVVPEKYTVLSEQDRMTYSKVNTVVHVAVNVRFLKSGIDLLDLPGLGENVILSNVTKNIIRKELPFIVYIIDGRTSVKQSDITDIIDLKSINPYLEIFYFVTKLDVADSEASNFNPIKRAEDKMAKAFSILQKNNLIPDNISNWRDYSHFHGASLPCRTRFLAGHIDEETTFHNALYSKFEASLLTLLLNYFQKKVYVSCDKLIEFIMSVLTRIIHHAQNFANKVQENLVLISEIKKLEEHLYGKIKDVITCSKGDLTTRILERLGKERDKLLNPIKDGEYPLSISVPQDGLVSDVSIIRQCQENIRVVLIHGLENVIKDFVDEELFKKYKLAVANKRWSYVQTTSPDIQYIDKGKSRYQIILEDMLDRNYKIDELSSTNDSRENTTIEFINVILTSLKDFLANIFPQILNENVTDVKSLAWKMTQAQQLLKNMNIHLLAEDVCKRLIENFNNKHKTFIEAMERERKFIQQDILSNNEIRLKIVSKAPQFFERLLNVVSIKGSYQFRGVKNEIRMGDGNMISVRKCSLNGKQMAMKTVKMQGSDEDVQIIRDKIAEGVYYSLLISHSRILPVLGLSIDEKKMHISLFYPLMKCNLKTYVQVNVLNLKRRVIIAFQVVEGLKYLHDHDIMHRDLKMENILMDEEDNVYLSDFRFLKSEALSNYTNVGFPGHIAPEMFYKAIYKRTVDIYAFGKILSALLMDKGSFEKKDHKVRNVQEKMLPGVPQSIKQLLIDCVKIQPEDRPNVDRIIEVLLEFVSQ